MNDAVVANPDQAAHWGGAGGRTWVEMRDVLDRMLAPFIPPLIHAAYPGEGKRVLDVGCGAGATTLAMARRLGPGGLCTGVDISAPLIAEAQSRAEAESAPGAAFVLADAQVHRFAPHSFDAVMSRFGVMFFEDPEAAFANLRNAARPGAGLAFLAWRSPQENAFLTLPMRALASFRPPGPPPDPNAPGQFAFADSERVRSILEASGWTALEVTPIDVPCEIAGSEIPAFVTRMGGVGPVLEGLDEPTRARAVEAVTAAISPHVREGAARFEAACWLVRGRA